MKIPRGYLEKPENNDDCRALAPLVMALFDGESDEIEARRARAHLLICQTCARRWLDWNRSRDLLHAAPVPAPPPQLLWRVLMACRLASGVMHAQPKTNHQRPEHLSAQILARTTRITQNEAPRLTQRVHSLRISALAVPALAVWLMILQRDVWLPAPIATASFSPSQTTPNSSARRSAIALPPAPNKTRVGLIRMRAARGIPLTLDATSQDEIRPGSLRPLIRSVSLSRRTTHQTVLFAPSQSAAVRVDEMTRDFDADPRREPPQVRVETRPVSVLPALSSRSARPPLLAGWAASSAQKRGRLREKFDPMPVLRRARPVWTGTVSPPSAPQKLRVSLPTNSAPQPARLLAENFDSEDANLDEIRSVVADFRATLSPDDATNSEAGPDDLSG